jgi:hypothetical protein
MPAPSRAIPDICLETGYLSRMPESGGYRTPGESLLHTVNQELNAGPTPQAARMATQRGHPRGRPLAPHQLPQTCVISRLIYL